MTNLVTAEEVYDATGLTLNFTEIASAQSVLEACSGLNLSMSAPEERYTKRDLRILKNAVFAQVAYLDKNPDALHAQGNVSSVSNNGVSVAYGSAGTEGFLSPLASRYLSTLSAASVRASSSPIEPFRPTPEAELNWTGRWRTL